MMKGVLIRITTLALLGLTAGVVTGCLAWSRRGAVEEPLPSDPALVTGTLPNGLAYVVRKNATPPGRVSLWLHVSSGSLNETEETRGLAHYLEHMAFNGSASFPPGTVVPFFQSLGMSFGRDQNAFTGFEQTTYTLTLPDPRPETLDKGLLFLSDVAFRLSLATPEIDNERQIILEEKRARSGPEQRTQEYVYERLAPESTYGRRFPIGTEEAIRAVTRPVFLDYYRAWYAPSGITLIVVGDVEPPLVVDLLTRHFGREPARSRPADRPVGVEPTRGVRAIVATDPELTRGEVSLVRLEKPRAPTTTVSQRRQELVEQLAVWAFNQRVGAAIARGEVAFREASAASRQQTGAARFNTVEAAGRPEVWPAMLKDLGVAVERARLHGFSDREVADAKAAFLARAEESVQREATLPTRDHLWQINSAVTRREPVLSAAQRLALLRRLLPSIPATEVSTTFATLFDFSNVVVVAELPSTPAAAGASGPAAAPAVSGGPAPQATPTHAPPTEAELVRLAREALDVRPERVAEADRSASLLDAPPASGRVVAQEEHAASRVLSAWLDNGVRVHHRAMDERAGNVTVTISLAGGEIEETAATRGLTEAATEAWDRPATSRLSSVQIRDLLIGKQVRTSGRAGADAVTLTITGTPADLEVGLQLAYLLLTDPLLEPAALAQWQDSEIQAIQSRRTQPSGVLAEAMAEAFFPAGEARLQPLTPEQVRAVTRDAAQAWMTRLIREAPIEVAVVGDLPRERALELVSRYLGSLPARPRVSTTTFEALRAVPRPAGPLRVERTIVARTPQAVVLDGFFGTDLRNVRDVRRLAMAARILTTRMTRTIREEKQLVYSIGAGSQPAVEYPGFGRFAAQAPTDPVKGDALAQALDTMYSAFAEIGPSEDEVEVARKQLVNQLDVLFRDPEFWSNRLGTLDYRGLRLDDLMAAPAAYQAMGASDVREGFAGYYRPEGRFRFVITPVAP